MRAIPAPVTAWQPSCTAGASTNRPTGPDPPPPTVTATGRRPGERGDRHPGVHQQVHRQRHRDRGERERRRTTAVPGVRAPGGRRPAAREHHRVHHDHRRVAQQQVRRVGGAPVAADRRAERPAAGPQRDEPHRPRGADHAEEHDAGDRGQGRGRGRHDHRRHREGHDDVVRLRRRGRALVPGPAAPEAHGAEGGSDQEDRRERSGEGCGQAHRASVIVGAFSVMAFLRGPGVRAGPYDRASPAPTVRPGARGTCARTAERSQRSARSLSGAAATVERAR